MIYTVIFVITTLFLVFLLPSRSHKESQQAKNTWFDINDKTLLLITDLVTINAIGSSDYCQHTERQENGALGSAGDMFDKVKVEKSY